MTQRTVFGGLLCAALAVAEAPLWGQQGAKGGDWPNHGGDKGFTRYSPLDQINRDNIKNLRVAWRRPAVAYELKAQFQNLKYNNKLFSTPLMVDGVLYASNGVGLVEAFDPATGKTIWVQELPEPGAIAGNASRGIAYWKAGDGRLLSVRPPAVPADDRSQDRQVDQELRRQREGGPPHLRRLTGPGPLPLALASARHP